MMAKGKASVYFCQSCGYESSKWMGQCPGCKEWNSFVEEFIDKKHISGAGKKNSTLSEAKVLPLSAIAMTQEERFKAPLDFIEALRERMIILEVAEEQKINPDEVKLTKEDNNRVSLKDVCKLMDEDADFFVSSDCPFSYILNYVGKYSNCGTYYNTRSKE